MTKIEYKIRSIRLNDETWKKLKEMRWKSKLSWNKFVLKLLKDGNKNLQTGELGISIAEIQELFGER